MQWNCFRNYLNKRIHNIMSSKSMKFYRMKASNNKVNKIMNKSKSKKHNPKKKKKLKLINQNNQSKWKIKNKMNK